LEKALALILEECNMAMFEPIPLPKHRNIFEGIVEAYERGKERKMKKPLMEAQTQQALANAKEKTMLADLMSMAFGGGGGAGNGGSFNNNQQQTDVSQSNPGAYPGNSGYRYDANGNNVKATPQEVEDIANGQGDSSQGIQTPQQQPQVQPQVAQSQPSSGGIGQQKAKAMLQALGYLKETPEEQSSREIAADYQKERGKSKSKSIDELDKSILSGTTSLDTLNELGEIIQHPEWEKMRQHPILGNYELAYYKINGNPQQKFLIGQYETNTGQIIKNAARDFPGQFRTGEQSLLNSMKLNNKDTFDSARGKLYALKLFETMMIERSKKISELMQKGYSKTAAIELAKQQIDGKKIKEQIKESLGLGSLERQAQDAIANGADPVAVHKRLEELRRNR
jgi:hypothetical protein